ncbi:MAG: hypothetical protein ACXADL_16620 [Candidatus Thorarchaeota archaeon]|jgi:hypothetical protein
MTTTQTDVQVEANADATKENAQTLGLVYRKLQSADKALRSATAAIKAAWIGKGDIHELRELRFAAIERMDRVMDDSWTVLSDLPAGTTAPGGATPQTVALQYFNNALNRNLRKRITASDARILNRRSFG